MNKFATQFKTIGLTESDVDEKIESVAEIVHCVSSSNRLFRKTIKHLILRDIRLYFENETITPDDELKKFFPGKGIRTEWTRFSYSLDLKVPGLRLTKFAIVLLIIFALSTVTFMLWLIFAQTALFIHALVTKIPLIPMILMIACMLLALIAWLGHTALPAKTIEELTDKIISENLSDLLTDDRKKYKEMILNELTEH